MRFCRSRCRVGVVCRRRRLGRGRLLRWSVWRCARGGRGRFELGLERMGRNRLECLWASHAACLSVKNPCIKVETCRIDYNSSSTTFASQHIRSPVILSTICGPLVDESQLLAHSVERLVLDRAWTDCFNVCLFWGARMIHVVLRHLSRYHGLEPIQ